jgi:hypothetical protein
MSEIMVAPTALAPHHTLSEVATRPGRKPLPEDQRQVHILALEAELRSGRLTGPALVRARRRLSYLKNRDRWFGAARRERLRRRFREDAEYRERRRTRERAGRPAAPSVQDDIAHKIARIAACGRVRRVRWPEQWGEAVQLRRVLTLKELQALMGVSGWFLWSWQSMGKMPRPVLRAERLGGSYANGQAAFGPAEIRALLTVLAEHKLMRLSRNDSATIAEICAAIGAARARMAAGTWD